MANTLESEGVEAEKAEAMRNYNNRSRSFRNILRAVAVASLVYLWFPTVAISLQVVADWFYRTGVVIVTNRTVVLVVANLLVGLIFVLSRDDNDDSSTSSDTKPDLYEQYTSSSAVTVTVEKSEDDDSKKQIVTVEKSEEEEDDSKKQIVPAFVEEAVTSRDLKGIYRRTKSEKKKEIIRPAVTEFRRTESAKVVAMERLSNDEFRLKVERFIMEKKRSLVQENDAVLRFRPWLDDGAAFGSGYGSC